MLQERLRFLLLKSKLCVVCADSCKQRLKQFSNFLAAQVKRSLSHGQFKHGIARKKRGSKSVKQPSAGLLSDVKDSRCQFVLLPSNKEVHHIGMRWIWHDLDLRE